MTEIKTFVELLGRAAAPYTVNVPAAEAHYGDALVVLNGMVCCLEDNELAALLGGDELTDALVEPADVVVLLDWVLTQAVGGRGSPPLSVDDPGALLLGPDPEDDLRAEQRALRARLAVLDAKLGVQS